MIAQRRRLWIAGAIVLASLGFLLFQGLGNATMYFHTTDEAVAQREDLGERRFRLEGTVVPGSVSSSGGVVFFRVAGNTEQVRVVHRGDPPELFKAGIPVVLEGRFADDGGFASDKMLVKHTESYVADHPDRVTTVPQRTP